MKCCTDSCIGFCVQNNQMVKTTCLTVKSVNMLQAAVCILLAWQPPLSPGAMHYHHAVPTLSQKPLVAVTPMRHLVLRVAKPQNCCHRQLSLRTKANRKLMSRRRSWHVEYEPLAVTNVSTALPRTAANVPHVGQCLCTPQSNQVIV